MKSSQKARNNKEEKGEAQKPDPFAEQLQNLPPNLVALMLWRDPKEYGPDPITFVVTKASFEYMQKKIKSEGEITPEKLYWFDTPQNPQGRRSVFYFTRVVGMMGNFHSPIIMPK